MNFTFELTRRASFGLGDFFSNPLWILHFRFHIVSINPRSIAGINSFQKVSSSPAGSKSSWQMAKRLSLWSCVRSRGTNFETTRCISNFVVRMSWHDPIDMLQSSAISRTVKRLERTISRACAIWASSHDVEGRPKRGPPFITTCTAHALITINVFHHFMSFRKRFP
jgi:hypothetical protein